MMSVFPYFFKWMLIFDMSNDGFPITDFGDLGGKDRSKVNFARCVRNQNKVSQADAFPNRVLERESSLQLLFFKSAQ